jgi:hypothetical protein
MIMKKKKKIFKNNSFEKYLWLIRYSEIIEISICSLLQKLLKIRFEIQEKQWYKLRRLSCFQRFQENW